MRQYVTIFILVCPSFNMYRHCLCFVEKNKHRFFYDVSVDELIGVSSENENVPKKVKH